MLKSSLTPFVALYSMHKAKGLGLKSLNQIIDEMIEYQLMPKTPAEIASIIQRAQKQNTRIKLPSQDQLTEWMYRAKAIHDECTGQNITIITPFSPLYPTHFVGQPEKPAFLFVKGKIDLLGKPAGTAIIGSRKPSTKIYDDLIELSKNIAKTEIIVSGLAEGCDHAGHKGALIAKGATIAVLGCSFDKIPNKSSNLAKRIVDSGGLLISEYPPGTTTKAYQLIRRNTLVAYLCSHVVVGQCSEGSGTMDTVNKAKTLGCDVHFLMPPIQEKRTSVRIKT